MRPNDCWPRRVGSFVKGIKDLIFRTAIRDIGPSDDPGWDMLFEGSGRCLGTPGERVWDDHDSRPWTELEGENSNY
jgi:hypothetical protein